jgi:phage shock protein A
MGSLLNSNSKDDVEYLITVKTEYKLLEKKYLKNRENLKIWETRITLAKEKNNLNLQIKAEEQVEGFQGKIEYLSEKLMELKIELEKVMRSIKESPQKLSIEPDKLLADMNNLIGNSAELELEKDINTIKVENELDRLKREL